MLLLRRYGGYGQGENYILMLIIAIFTSLYFYTNNTALKLSDMYRDDRIFIDKATPLYLCQEVLLRQILVMMNGLN